MKKLVVAVFAASAIGCTSIESATVAGNDIAANGDAIAVVQATSIGVTALFHMIDLVQSDLDVVVNKMLVSEAKAMGANKVDLKHAWTTPRHGVFQVCFPIVLCATVSSATGVAVK